jgi:hypothetical protein
MFPDEDIVAGADAGVADARNRLVTDGPLLSSFRVFVESVVVVALELLGTVVDFRGGDGSGWLVVLSVGDGDGEDPAFFSAVELCDNGIVVAKG